MRLQNIVIGLDFSGTAVDAAAWAARAFAPTATLRLVHAIEPMGRPPFGRALPSAEVVERAARDFAERRLGELEASFAPRRVTSEIRVGKAADVVLDVARETSADLVIIGPHGERPRPTKLLGSTADRIVRQSPIPVLVATNPGKNRPQRLLVPVDDASVTPHLLSQVHDLARVFDASVTLLHAWSNSLYSYVASMSHATAGSEAEAKADIEKEMATEGKRWLEELARTGLPQNRVNAMVTYGNAGDATLEVADGIGADLIVMGKRGSGLVAPALLGSTVGTVLHGARCPVLVVTDAP